MSGTPNKWPLLGIHPSRSPGSGEEEVTGGVTEPVATGQQGVGQGGRTKAVRVPHPLGLLMWDVRPSAAQGIIPLRMRASLTSSLPRPPGARMALTVSSARHALESALQILDPESSAQGSRLGLAPRFLEHPHLFKAQGEQKQGSNRHSDPRREGWKET